MRTLISATLILVFGVSAASAQAPPTATVTATAPIYLKPGAQTPLRVAASGTLLKVLKEEGEWIEVEFNDPQFGRRVGWVEATLVRIARPELQPMDLSLRDVPAQAVERAPRLQSRTDAELAAIVAAAAPRSRGWIDVNFGAAASAQRGVTAETNIPDGGGEFATMRVGYNAPRGAEFDFGGGFMITPVVGFGIQFTGTAHRGAADLSIRIPHPRFFDAHASDGSVTDTKLKRTEGGVNLSLVAAVPSTANLQVRFYGGPTYFRLQADAVNNIQYFHQFGFFTTVNSVDITSSSTREVEETAWGVHGGVDLGYFFSRHVGIGGFARLTRGTVTFTTDDFMLDENLDVKVGGFQAGGGLRLRF